MNITLERIPLLKTLSHLQSLVEKKSTIHILSHLLIKTQKNAISITGTDLDMSLVQTVQATITQEGEGVVPAHLLYDIVKKLNDAAFLQLEIKDSQLYLQGGRATFILPTLPVEHFPAFSGEAFSFQWSVSSGILKQLLEDTKFCMSQEEARYALNGIFFHIHEGEFRAVATDAHRLALSAIPLSQESRKIPSMILGRKTVYELVKLLDEYPKDTMVDVSISSHQVKINLPYGIFQSKLLFGEFPDYQKAIPLEHPYVLDVSSSILSQGISRVAMMTHETHRVLRLSLSQNTLELSARSSQYGFAKDSLSVVYDGPVMSLGLNPRYFLEICAGLRGETIRLNFLNDRSPVIFQSARSGEDSIKKYIMMPIPVTEP